MASELLVKRLMMQASVSVLAGLLMSSAVMAGDMSEPVSEPGVVSVDDSGMVDGDPDVSIDPVDPGDWSGEDDGMISLDPREWDGTFNGEDDGSVDDGGYVGVDEDGKIGITVDDSCADCSGTPDVEIDPSEMGEQVDGGIEVTMADGGVPRGGAPNERGDVGSGGHDVSRDQGHGEGRESDFVWKARQLIK